MIFVQSPSEMGASRGAGGGVGGEGVREGNRMEENAGWFIRRELAQM